MKYFNILSFVLRRESADIAPRTLPDESTLQKSPELEQFQILIIKQSKPNR